MLILLSFLTISFEEYPFGEGNRWVKATQSQPQLPSPPPPPLPLSHLSL